MRKTAPCLVALALVLPAGGGESIQPPPRIHNVVVDLLDAAVALESVDDVWESEPFKTDRFTVIGLRLSGDVAQQSGIACTAAWQYGADDEFQESVPVAGLFRPPTVLFPPQTNVPDFAEVRGLRARVVCRAYSTGFGDEASGMLTDVQVLLRSASPASAVSNQVLDLLDDRLLLDSEGDVPEWESPPIDTGQFTRIGVHVAGEVEGLAGITCDALWRFAGEGDYLDPGPSVALGDFPGPVIDGGRPPGEFRAVRGTQAKVVCRPVFLGAPSNPPPVSGWLDDVTVLLRSF